jgi:hypothetical protein
MVEDYQKSLGTKEFRFSSIGVKDAFLTNSVSPEVNQKKTLSM